METRAGRMREWEREGERWKTQSLCVPCTCIYMFMYMYTTCACSLLCVNIICIPVISHWSVGYASPLSEESAERVVDAWLELAVAERGGGRQKNEREIGERGEGGRMVERTVT